MGLRGAFPKWCQEACGPLAPCARFAPATVLNSTSGSLAYASRSDVLHAAELAPERQAFASGIM